MLVKRIKYAGDIFEALVKRCGWDIDTATGFLESIPDAPHESLRREAFWKEYATSSFYGYDKNREPKWAARKFYRCESCRKGTAVRTNYCPNCGAKMDLEG